MGENNRKSTYIGRRRRRLDDGWHTPRLPGLLPVTITAVILLLAAFVGLYMAFAWLSGAPVPFPPVRGNVPSGTLADLLRSVVSAGTLIAGTFALVYAYRKQRIEEAASHRADSEQLSKRFQEAASQLGHERSAVRLAGIYSIARLADDWCEKRQMCVDLLCAYLRMPYPNETLDADEVVVREAVTSVIRDHLTDPDDPLSWCDIQLDFSGATLVNVNFAGSHFQNGVSFSGATFTGRTESFERGVYVGGSFQGCIFSGRVSFFQARIRDAIVSFDDSTFDVEELWFGGLEIEESNVFFRDCTFRSGHIYFGGVSITRRGTIDTLGSLWFDRSDFMGARMRFTQVTLNGGVELRFNDVKLRAGTLHFDEIYLVAVGDLMPIVKLRVKAHEKDVLHLPDPVPTGITLELPGRHRGDGSDADTSVTTPSQ